MIEPLRNFYTVADNPGQVSDAKVYGLADAVRRAKYAKAIDSKTMTSELTPGIRSLANAPAGSAHDHWLCGVNVQFDLTFTIKAWTEAERYNWFDIVTSQSTMHRITRFDLDKAYSPYVDHRIVAIMKEKVAAYNEAIRAKGIGEPSQADPAELYLEILYSNPAGMYLTAGMTTNYLQLKTIYHQRKTHRLPEWQSFCRWIERLPESYLITGGDAA